MSRTLRWIVGPVVAAVVLVTAGTYAYIHWISDDAPPRLTLDAQRNPSEIG